MIEIKPYSISEDGTMYFVQEESTSYAKKLGLKNIIVLRKVSTTAPEKYVIKDYNQTIHSTPDLASIGIFLEKEADKRNIC